MLRGTKAKWLYWAALLLPLVGGLPARGQVASAAEGGSQLGGFVAFGAQKTHVNAFNFNSLGMEGGIYLQKSRFFGIELKGDVFPFYARFKQAPFTAGYRVSGHLSRLHGMEVFGYFGGGMARSQNAGGHYETLDAQWSPCWQGSQGVNIPIRSHFKWKAYEVSYTQTYDTLRTLESVSVTTGVTYTLGR